MNPPSYALAFVRGEQGELFVHADPSGLALLIAALQQLKQNAEAGICEHTHLMTPACGGTALSEPRGYETGELIHHVKLYGWPRDWATRHGFLP